MANIIDKLKNLFKSKGAVGTKPVNQQRSSPNSISAGTQTAVFTETAVLDLMQQIEATNPDMYDCETTFALLDEYVDLVSTDAEKAALMPLVKKHLEVCPKCQSKYEILLQILQTEEN